MNYEQKYKEIIHLLKDLYPNFSDYTKEKLENKIPELKENEVVRIKKMLRDVLSQWKNEIPAWCSDIKLIDATLKWIEQQGEQKPTDKVDPKFKVGDWVQTDGGHVMKILDVKKDVLCYKILNWCGNESVRKISDIDSIAHLWTIQDAKDGDVLFTTCDNINEMVFIYHGIELNVAHCYFLYSKTNNECKTFNSICSVKADIHPATKEQRELLFQKMKEAGYEWDAEKKELKKIEQSCYHNDGLYYAIDILEKTFGKVEGYQSNDGKIEHQTAIETVNALYHKKPTEWSEEDERIKREIAEALKYGLEEGSALMPCAETTLEEALSWLEKQGEKKDPCENCDHPMLNCVNFPCEKKQINQTLPKWERKPDESEDERIRKSLIKGFQHYDKESKWGEFTTTEILAWLEKHKKTEVKVFIPKFRVGDVVIGKAREKWMEPAKITFIDKNGYYVENTDGRGGGGYIGASFEDEYELDKSAEWSEEDVLQYSKILFCLDSMIFPSTVERKEMIDWLKSLKPQSHWKPSEAEMRTLSEAISNIRNGIRPYCSELTILEELYNNLKKL